MKTKSRTTAKTSKVSIPDNRHEQGHERKRSEALFLLVFCLMVTGIAAAGYLSYGNFERDFRAQMESQLSAIATLKMDDLENWRNERLGNAEVLRRNAAFAFLVQNFLEDPGNTVSREQLRAWLDSLVESYEYQHVYLLDTSGAAWISSSNGIDVVDTHLQAEISPTLQGGQVVVLDFHRHESDQDIYLSLLVPLYAGQDLNKPLGVLVMEVDPHTYLYPYLSTWPATSKTAETLLVRRDGNELFYLTPLRFRSDAALDLRIPLENTDVLAVKAVLGETGVVEGMDYRGEPVIGAIGPVPNSPWFLVARMDKAEVFAPLRQRLWQTLAFFGALILASGAGLIITWRQQRLSEYQARVQTLEQLRASEQKFKLAFETSPDSIAITRLKDGQFVSVNGGFERILGYTAEEVFGRTSLEMSMWEDPQERQNIVSELQTKGRVENFEARFRTKDGTTRHGLMSVAVIQLNGEPHILNITRDITERKRAEEALKESEERFSTAFFTSPVSQSIVNQGTNEIMAVNDACCRLFGYQREELIGASTAKLNLWEESADWMAAVEELQKTGHLLPREATIRVRSGEIRTVIVAIEPIAWKGLPCLISSVFDITERKQAETELVQMKRLYATLSQVNQTIVRVENQQELFDSICKVAVEFGGFRLVWIGLLDPQTDQVTPMAQYGKGQNKLPFQSIDAKEDLYRNDLIGLSLQSGLVQSSEDIQADARMAHWHEAAIQGYYHSAAAVPFKQNGKIIGLLNLYAADIGFFTMKEEQRLLEEMGLDISFALDNMDRESRHRQAEEERFQLMQVLESSLNEIYIFDDTTLRFTYVNQGALKNIGYLMDELRLMTPIDLKPEFTEQLFREMIRPLVLREKDILVFETVHRRKNGVTYPVEVHLQLVETQESRNFVAIIHDVTERKQAEEKLITSETHYRRLFESAKDGILILDNETGIIVDVNPFLTTLLGYPKEAFLEKHIWELGFFKDIAANKANFLELQQKEYIRYEDLPLETAYGYRIDVEFVSNTYQVGHQKVIQCNIRNITERKRAEERIKTQLERLASLRAIDTAIISSTNLNMTFYVLLTQAIVRLKVDAASILTLNPVTNELEVCARQGFYATDFQNVRVRMGKDIAGRCALGHAPLEEHFLTKEDFTSIAPALREEGFTCYIAMPLINKSKILGVLELFERGHRPHDQDWVDFLDALVGQAAIAIDNFQLFDGLQRSNVMLERRVAERTRELHQTNAELEHANRAKNEFLATMSHELRTPLNSVLGLSESLLEQRRGPLNEHQQKSLQIIEASGHHLLDLINDILDLSKIDAGKFDIYRQIVEVNTLCQSSLTFVRQQATRKSISLVYEEDKTISKFQADPRRVKQILVNLLTNAVKFTPEGGRVTLQVRASAEQDLVQFSVIDNGIGIAPEDLKRLFQPFVQVDSHLNRQFEGTGLGLALVQKLIDLHGGSVQVESEVNKGSRFTVNLPWQRDIPEAEEAANSKSGDSVATEGGPKISSGGTSNHKVILLAEDNIANILTIGEYLESHGYAVAFAHDGWEAISKAEEINPALILMDIQMPSLDGLEATRRLRANPRFATTPIIALTALAMSGDRERCLEAGANEYMSKPVKLRMLVKIIETMLEPGKDISQ